MQSGWIKTSERKPKNFESVLVWEWDGQDSRAVIETWIGCGWKPTASRGAVRDALCVGADYFEYWQPLPGSPVMEGLEAK